MFDLWKQLQTITHYRFSSTSGKRSNMNWQGVGHGQVTTAQDGSDCLIFDESGEFCSTINTNTITTHNVFIWQKVTVECIRLSHARFGREHQVKLFDLVPNQKLNQWDSHLPHHCGDDIYSGNVLKTDSGLKFIWKITGPRKDEQLYYDYTNHPIS